MPTKHSIERNAGASANINSRKDDEATARLSAYAHCVGCKNSNLPTFLGIIDSWSNRKIGSKAIAKNKATHRTTLSYSSGNQELSSFCSPEFQMFDAVAVNTSQEATEKAEQSSVLDHREDPRVIDTGFSSGKDT